VDNRTGFRRRGHAYLADQARLALGFRSEPNILSDLPAPLVHTALGAAVCAVAILLRPEALGMQRSAIASGCLAIFTGILLITYDILVYPPESRPGLDGVALPVAAVGSFATVLAGVTPLTVRLAAGVVAALVIGGVPHLAGRRAVGREGWMTRLGRDAAGVAVLAPVLVAGVSPVLPLVVRIGLVGAIAVLVSLDGFRTEQLTALRSLVASVIVGAGVAGAAAALGTSATNPGYRAAGLLVLWYGLRGVAGVAASSAPRQRLAFTEYAAFVVLAAAGLGWVAAVNP
jgi:hypothetical protein